MCGCYAGKGLKATYSCKHVGALCYVFAKICKSGQVPEFLSCTEQL